MKFLFIIIIFFFIYQYSLADVNNMSINLNIRERFENWNGMNKKIYGDNSADAAGGIYDNFLLQRIAAGFTYNIGENFVISAHSQDSRAFGWSLRQAQYPDLFKIHSKETPSPYYIKNPNEEFFELYDLFIQYKDMIEGLSITAGRQKISFGDTRIFGRGEWGNSGRWNWDALKLTYSEGLNTYNLWAGGTKINDPNQTNIPFTNNEYYGIGTYNTVALYDDTKIEPFLATKWQGSADYIENQNINHYWLGARLVDSNYYNFDYDFTAVKQFGNDNGKDINAFGIASRIGYKAKDIAWSPLLSVRYVYASGGEGNNEINTFDPVYGSRDKYYGRMNIVRWRNLSDFEISLELFPIKKMWVELKYNYLSIPKPENFSFGKNLRLKPGCHHLGDEIDVWIEYKDFYDLSIVILGGYFIPADVEKINDKPANNSGWIALQLSYKFNYIF